MAVVGITLYTIVLLLPGGTAGYTTGIDDSWQFVVSRAFAEGWEFGKDVIFTYGPLGFGITDHYYPDTFFSVVLIRALLAIATIGNASALFEHFDLGLPTRVMLLAALATVVSFSYFHEAAFLGLGILLVARHFLTEREKPGALLILLAIAIAVTSLVKFTYFVSSVIVVGGVSLDATLRQRRIPWIAVVFVTVVVGTWIAAGQPLGNLIPYLLSGVSVASGYNEAVGSHLGDPLIGVTDANAFFLFASVLAVAAYRATAATGDRAKAVFHTLSLAGALFVVFKTTFVRHDEHALISADAGLLFALCYLPVVVRRATSTRMAWLYVGLLVGLPMLSGVLAGRAQAWQVDSLFRNPIACATTRLLQARTAAGALVDSRPIRRTYDDNLARLRRENLMPVPTGSVDLFCNQQALALAYGLDYRPRPVFQSYSAYLPSLAEINAEFLRGPRAPDTILYQLETIDTRFPTQDDTPAFLEILRRYRADEGDGAWIVFKRTGAVRGVSLVSIGECTARFGESIDVPSDEGLVWAAIDIAPTGLGRIAILLYKPPMLFITPQGEDIAVERKYRLVPALARNGFLLSPLTTETGHVRAIVTPSAVGRDALPRVETVRVDGTRGASVAYNPEFRVRFYRLTIEPEAEDSSIITKGDH
jgi:hypothetical protein